MRTLMLALTLTMLCLPAFAVGKANMDVSKVRISINQHLDMMSGKAEGGMFLGEMVCQYDGAMVSTHRQMRNPRTERCIR